MTPSTPSEAKQSESKQIVLVRHGQTEWSKSGQHTSHTDLPLLPEGEEQAAELAKVLSNWNFAAVYTSPRQRAVRTAELAGYGAALIEDDNLQEWDYGDFEGRTLPDIHEESPGWNLWKDGAPGGEQPGDVLERTENLLDLVEDADGNVLMFAHGHILRAFATTWLDLPLEHGEQLSLDPCCLGILGYKRDLQILLRWNQYF